MKPERKRRSAIVNALRKSDARENSPRKRKMNSRRSKRNRRRNKKRCLRRWRRPSLDPLRRRKAVCSDESPSVLLIMSIYVIKVHNH